MECWNEEYLSSNANGNAYGLNVVMHECPHIDLNGNPRNIK